MLSQFFPVFYDIQHKFSHYFLHHCTIQSSCHCIPFPFLKVSTVYRWYFSWQWNCSAICKKIMCMYNLYLLSYSCFSLITYHLPLLTFFLQVVFGIILLAHTFKKIISKIEKITVILYRILKWGNSYLYILGTCEMHSCI